MSDFSALTILRSIGSICNKFVELYTYEVDVVLHTKAKNSDRVLELSDNLEAAAVTFLLNSAYNQGRNDALKELAAELTTQTPGPTVLNLNKKE